MEDPKFAHLRGEAKKALRSRLRYAVRNEMLESRDKPSQLSAPERRPQSQSARRKAQQDDSLLALWAEGEEEAIPMPENEDEEAWQLRVATEDSRHTLRRRVDDDE